MAWPTSTINTTNLDAGADSPASARADLKVAVDSLNSIITSVAGHSSYITGVQNLADSDAQALAAAAFDFNTITAQGQIEQILGGPGTATRGQVETAVRPLACLLSCLLADLRAIGVI